MAYSRKFSGLFGSLGYNYTVDCTTETAEAILIKIANAFEDRANLAAEAALAQKRGLTKLVGYEQELQTLMRKLLQ